MLKTPELSSHIVRAMEDAKALDIVSIDVRKLTDITDQMIICHGSSARHAGAIARKVVESLALESMQAASIEGETLKEWILIDYIDVIVHIMKRETREYYDLESLWNNRLTDPHSSVTSANHG